jgi:hypothetical protein
LNKIWVFGLEIKCPNRSRTVGYAREDTEEDRQVEWQRTGQETELDIVFETHNLKLIIETHN